MIRSIMYNIYNTVKRFSEYTLWLCLLALLPLDVHAFDKYGIFDGTTYTDVGTLYGTWNAAYQGMDANLSGSGTKQDPYRINDEWDLCRLEDQVNAGNSFKGKYFKLMNDIDLGGKIWYPIGVKSTAPFAGLFDGNDKTIKNMSIVLKDADYNFYSYGLFGFMKGVIRHLNMTNGYVVINRTESNEAQTLMVGLLCGLIANNMEENVFGAVYECNIQGSMGGNISNYFDMSYIGGIAGIASNPVAIYKCQVDVRMTPQDVRYVGGIVGYSSSLPDIPEGRENRPSTPCTSYIFDCVANVNILAELRESIILYCGGLCGMSDGELLACVSNGIIECNLDYMGEQTMEQVSMTMGGLTGVNGYTITSCISTVQLKGGKTVGGLIGENNNIIGPMHGNVLNSVFCGHIDSPDAEHTHGLLGNQKSSASVPFNCLFVGTMHGGKNKAPLSNGTTEKCYSDQNMYDDGKEWSCYKYTDEFGPDKIVWNSFKTDYQCNIGWLSKYYNKAFYIPLNINFYNCWVVKEGFYPYFKVDENNIANNQKDIDLVDYAIATAAGYFDDKVDVIRTPSLYEKYAWLSSVPMNVPNHNFRTDFVDTPISLAIKQQPLEGNNMKTATYSISDDKMTISGETNAQTAAPKDNVSGGVMLTITSDDNVSRSICLDIYTRHQWDEKVAQNYDGGNGTESNPYLIHNARQLMKAFTTNESGEYYRLTKDVWFNENLLTDTGEPKEGAVVWDHKSKRDSLQWNAHLDGDSHLVHGLYSTNAFGLIEKIQNGASIKNVGFVDCLVWSPEADPVQNAGMYMRPFSFLTPIIGATAAVSNCLFSGVAKERRKNTDYTEFGAFIHTIDNSSEQIGTTPVVQDCMLSIVGKSDLTDRKPVNALFCYKTGGNAENCAARRVLLLNNSNAEDFVFPIGIKVEDCHFPEGYLPQNNTTSYSYGRQVSEMTNGTFFTGDSYGKWTAMRDRFPILTSFATTDDSKLIALPIYASTNNRLGGINYLLDFTPGAASWSTTNSSALALDTDIRVIEPKQIKRTAYLVRSMNDTRIMTPVTTATVITLGIQFSDVEAKKFCLAHYDINGDNAISLSELKNVTLSQFQADMNENDGNAYDNDGELIELFPEFRYFAGVNDLGTSFQEKDKLQQLAFSGNIKALPDNAFKGTTSMTSFTVPVSVTTFGAHPFYNSGLESFEVETDHAEFADDNGLLTNKEKTTLLCWPNGKQGFDVEVPEVVNPSSAPSRRRVASLAVKGIEVPANLTSLASNSIFKVPSVNGIFLNSADYDYETVKEPEADAVTKADNVGEIRYYVKDATNDSQNNYQDEETGEGNGHLLNRYKASPLWTGKTMERYWVLEINAKSKDSQGRYWATMYIGFDTQLPEGLTAYIVDKEKTSTDKSTLVLRKIGRKVPMMTPVVVRAEKAKKYILFPSKEAKYEELGMSVNLLDGINRNGLDAYQSDANDGSCLTLGVNKSGKVGFFIYKGKAKIPAFRAYISVNKVDNAQALELTIPDDSTTGIKTAERDTAGESSVTSPVYNLKGQRVGRPEKGVYINDRRIIIKK